jgi:hypothetical protein
MVLFRFHWNNGYANASQCYIIRALPVLLISLFNLEKGTKQHKYCRFCNNHTAAPHTGYVSTLFLILTTKYCFGNVWRHLCSAYLASSFLQIGVHQTRIWAFQMCGNLLVRELQSTLCEKKSRTSIFSRFGTGGHQTSSKVVVMWSNSFRQ